MNYRVPPHRPVDLRRALQRLSLLLLPAFAPHAMYAVTHSNLTSRASQAVGPVEAPPYLPALGPPPLRFQEEAPPPPDLVTRPAAGAPPVPALSPTESSVALANAAAAGRSLSAIARGQDEAPVTELEPVQDPKAAKKPAPAPILRDEFHNEVRPEDFLPFFQVPGTPRPSDDAPPAAPEPPRPAAAPTPAPLPPSTATYTQSK